MVAILRRLKTLGKMFIPLGVFELQRRMASRKALSGELLRIIERNIEVKNRHRGERCFILGNAPSAKLLDLARLKGEVVISVSNGYLHKDFDTFMPRYHCVPQIASGRMTEQDIANWFGEMDERLGGAELFLSTQEKPFVQRYELFPARTVRFMHFQETFDDIHELELIDISKPVPGVESVPIMALMLAMYMGFRDIVLLGVDHDSWKTNRYHYPFQLDVQTNKDTSVSQSSEIVTPNYDTFQSMARLWRQYRKLSLIAQASGVRITNASGAGELDEFPRVSPAVYGLAQ